jgi:WD40 repeat protein
LKVWDLNTGNYLFDITGVPSHPTSLAMSWDGAIVVVWSDSTGWVWDGRTGAEKLRLEAPSPEGGFGYSKGSPVVADDDGTAIVSDGMTFLCLDRNSGSIVLWDLNTGLSRPLKNELPLNPIVAIAASQDGGYVACGLRIEQAIEVVDVKSGGLVSTLRGLEVAPGSRIAISPDNEIVLACTSGKTGRAWELKTGKAIKPLCDVFRAIGSWDMDVLRFMFLCGSTFVATYLSHTKKAHLEVKIWDASTGEEVVETKLRIPDSASQPTLSRTESIRDHLVGPDRWIHAVYSDRRRYSVCYLPLLYGAITSSCFRGDIGIVGFDSGRVLTFRMPVPHVLAS